MAMNPFTWVNRRGSAAIRSTGVAVGAASVKFTFRNHAFLSSWYRGTVFVDLAQAIPAGTTGTLPVVFETNGVEQAVTKYNGEPLTADDIPGTGIFELWYDKSANVLQLLTGVV